MSAPPIKGVWNVRPGMDQRERERQGGGRERERERRERERKRERETERARARAREHVMCGNGLDNMTRCTPQKGFGSRV